MSRTGAQTRTGVDTQVGTWTKSFKPDVFYPRTRAYTTRPSDWPSIATAPTVGVEFLVKIYENQANLIAFSASFSGSVSVNWGDGTTTTYATGLFERDISYANAPSATTTSEGYRICRVVATPVTGGSITGWNFNILHSSCSANTGNKGSSQILELAVSGSAVTTFIISPEQAFPPSGGIPNTPSINHPDMRYFRWHGVCNVTSLNVTFRYLTGLEEVYFDNASACTTTKNTFAFCTGLKIATLNNLISLTNAWNMFQGCYSLEEVNLDKLTALEGGSYMFYNCNTLQRVELIGTSALLDSTSMFDGCTSLQSVYMPNHENIGNAYYMFQGCKQLTSVTLHLPNCYDLTGAFLFCGSLTNLQLTGTSGVTSFQDCFNGTGIKEITLDTRAATLMMSAFNGCSTLQSVTLNSLSATTRMSNAFSNCTSLRTITLPSASACTNWAGAFAFSTSLNSVNLGFSTSAATDLSSMFQGCNALRSVTNLDTRAATNMSNMFSDCSALSQITVNASAITSLASAPTFGTMGNLGRTTITNHKWDHSIANNKMDATRLNDHYTNAFTLPAAANITSGSVAGSTITITTSGAHTFWTGMRAVVAGVNPSTYNGTFTITVTASNRFTYVKAGVGAYVSGGTATPSANITVTANPGTATDNTTIATNKRWTVIG